MEQSFIEKIFSNYDHLKGKYLGCYCKDQMEQFSKAIKLSFLHDPNPRVFALINTGLLASSGEHWMGIVMNKNTKCCGYFDSFARGFKWLNGTLYNYFNKVHKTNHVVQSESSQTCGLHTIYFILEYNIQVLTIEMTGRKPLCIRVQITAVTSAFYFMPVLCVLYSKTLKR